MHFKLLMIFSLIANLVMGQTIPKFVLVMPDVNPQANLPFQGVKECCTYTFQNETTIKRFGNTSLRVELNKTDPPPTDGSGSKRAERYYNYASSKTAQNPNLRWFAFSMYSPSATNSSDPAEEIRFQLHSNVGSPVCALELKSGTWRIARRNSSGVTYTNLAAINYNQWEDWIFYFDESQASDGEIKVWRNDVLMYSYTGVTNYSNSNAIYPYPNIGIYKWPWASTWVPASTSTQRIFYLDSVFYGTTSATYADMDVTPSSPNISPVANAGANQTLSPGTTSTSLNGSGSNDPDGTITGYSWIQVSGPNTSTITTSTSATTSVTGLVPGTYIYQLTVIDNDGASASATVQVIVPVAANLPPVIDLSGNTITKPITNSFNVTAVITDPDNTVSSRLWQIVSSPPGVTLTNTSTDTVTVNNVTSGEYVLQIIATDNLGASTTDDITITVLGGYYIVPRYTKKEIKN